jgi:hypothetical protein
MVSLIGQVFTKFATYFLRSFSYRIKRLDLALGSLL